MKDHGRRVSSVSSGSGVDIIDYSPQLAHLYLPGAESATMAIVGVTTAGQLSKLGTFDTIAGSPR